METVSTELTGLVTGIRRACRPTPTLASEPYSPCACRPSLPAARRATRRAAAPGSRRSRSSPNGARALRAHVRGARAAQRGAAARPRGPGGGDEPGACRGQRGWRAARGTPRSLCTPQGVPRSVWLTAEGRRGAPPGPGSAWPQQRHAAAPQPARRSLHQHASLSSPQPAALFSS